MTEFRILGPVEASAAGKPIQLDSGRAPAILAILLMTPGVFVPADTLIDRLWGDSPSRRARETLPTYISRLRRALEPAGEDARLTGQYGGYVLRASTGIIDVHKFRKLRSQARLLAEDGEKEQAVVLAREASALWRGDAMAGVRGDWFGQMRDSLAEERRALLAERITWELDLGLHALLTGELAGLLALHPHDETLIACQMTALYRCGRPTDAQDLYRRTRNRLVQEQGAEPGAALAELHQRILRRDPGLDAPSRAESARPSTGSSNDETWGRPREAAQDPPAGRQQGGGRRSRRIPGSPAGQHPHGQPRHLPSNGSAAGRPQASLISAQSTAAFDAAYEALGPHHQLFLRRIALSPGPLLTAEAAAALAGVSLADASTALGVLADHGMLRMSPDGQWLFADTHELAAIRAARYDALAERRHAIGRLLDYYLTAGSLASAALFPARRPVAGASSCPPGIIPELTAAGHAEAWFTAEWQNILRAARYAAGHQRPRQCADLTFVVTGWLESSGHWDEAITACTMAVQECRGLADLSRTARAYLDLAAISQRAGRHDIADGLAHQAAEIHRSLGDRHGLAQAIDQIGQEHQHRGRAHEALAYFAEARAMYELAGDRAGMATALNHSAIACWQLGRYPEATERLRNALALCRETGDQRGEAKALSNLGKTQVDTGHYQDALASFSLSLDIFRKIGGAQSQANLRHLIGGALHRSHSYDEAITAYTQALDLYRGIGDLPDEADLHNDIGRVCVDADLPDTALSHYHLARQIARQIGSQPVQVTALRGIADVCRSTGRHAEAANSYQDALRLARTISDPYEEAEILAGLAETAISTGDPHTARISFRQAHDIFRRLGLPEADDILQRLDSIPPDSASRTPLTASITQQHASRPRARPFACALSPRVLLAHQACSTTLALQGTSPDLVRWRELALKPALSRASRSGGHRHHLAFGRKPARERA